MRSEKRKANDVFRTVLIISLLSLLPVSAVYAATLTDWAASFSQPATQQKIIALIFPATGPISAAKKDSNGNLYFPTNGTWAKLGHDFVWSPGKYPYMAVTCTIYREPGKPPINASSYLIRNATDRPKPLTGGFANQGRIAKVNLPGIRKSFLVLVSLSSGRGGSDQWGACLLESPEGGTSGNPRNVWISPNSARTFQFGFDKLGGASEELVFRTVKGKDITFSAYRWNGDRFEIDSFASESRLKELPDYVWSYGASL